MKAFWREKARKYHRYIIEALVSSVILSVLFWFLTVELFNCLGSFSAVFTDNDTVLRALENLCNVTVQPPLWWTIPVGVLLYGGILIIRCAWRRNHRRRLKAVLWGTACLVFLLLAFIFSVWMTKLNSIPVHTMVTVLWQYIATGALSGI